MMIPVAALLAWRDTVLERQIGALAVSSASKAADEMRKQALARDTALNDAFGALLTTQPDRAIAAVGRGEAERWSAVAVGAGREH